jgi:thiol-disulfide isomerase/thioredoxin
MKRIIFGILILGFIIAAIFVGYFVFNNSEPEPEPPKPIENPGPNPEPNPNSGPPLDTLLLDKEQTIPFDECSRRGLDDRVIILVSKYCSACKVVLPILKEIEQELNMEFLYFDLSDKNDVEEFEKLKLQAQWTPTVIIGCEVLIGGYSKEKYKTKIENLLNK